MYRWIISGMLEWSGKPGPVVAEALGVDELIDQIAQAAYAAPAPALQHVTHQISGPQGLVYLGWYERSPTKHPPLLMLNVVKRVVLVFTPRLHPSGWVAQRREKWFLEGEIERMWRLSGGTEAPLDLDELLLGPGPDKDHTPPAAGSGPRVPGSAPPAGYRHNELPLE